MLLPVNTPQTTTALYLPTNATDIAGQPDSSASTTVSTESSEEYLHHDQPGKVEAMICCFDQQY